MKTRSVFTGIGIAILVGMMFAGGMSIAAATRQEHKV